MSMCSRYFQWSNQTYSLKQFETSFADKLPQIVMIPDGHSAASNYYEFSSGDIYFVKKLARQPRLVVEDMVGRLLSIPFDYPIKVHVVKGDYIVDPAEKLSEIMSRNGNSLAGIDKIIFEDNETVNFEVGTVDTESGNCGVMTILDIYWERYYIGHSLMNDGLMHLGEVAIPIYVPISFKIAESLNVPGAMTFKQILTNAKMMAADFGDSTVTEANQPNPEIMLFKERDEDGYDYIVPNGWLTMTRASSDMTSGHDRRKPLAGGRRGTGPSRLEELGLGGKEKPLLDIGISLPRGAIMPAHGTRKAEQPFTTINERKLGQVDSENFTLQDKIKIISGLKFLPGVPNVNPSGAFKNRRPLADGAEINRPSVVKREPAPTGVTTETGGIRTWSDVPDDISDLSVGHIQQCMRLLKVNCQSDVVDGVYLKTLSEDDLTIHYKMSLTEAKRVVLFVKGWRPKI